MKKSLLIGDLVMLQPTRLLLITCGCLPAIKGICAAGADARPYWPLVGVLTVHLRTR
jgi:hypothetical protein